MIFLEPQGGLMRNTLAFWKQEENFLQYIVSVFWAMTPPKPSLDLNRNTGCYTERSYMRALYRIKITTRKECLSGIFDQG
jgi:hypothetical protein